MCVTLNYIHVIYKILYIIYITHTYIYIYIFMNMYLSLKKQSSNQQLVMATSFFEPRTLNQVPTLQNDIRRLMKRGLGDLPNDFEPRTIF